MPTLAELSDEVLDQILRDASLSVATLWTAGNRSLNKRIARCCRCVRTDASLKTFTVKKWPRMFSELLSLEVLSLDVQRFNEGLDTLKEQVQRLPPTVKALELRFLFASVLWLDKLHLTKVTSILPPLRYPIQVLPDGSYNSSCWDLKLHFPLLAKAVFTEKRDTRNLLRWHFSSYSFGIFPPSLTHLEWDAYVEPFMTFANLPKDLTWLDFGARNTAWFPPTHMDLPPLLVHLNGIPFNNAEYLATSSLISQRPMAHD